MKGEVLWNERGRIWEWKENSDCCLRVPEWWMCGADSNRCLWGRVFVSDVYSA